MNISGMKELDQYTVDKIAEVFGKMPTWPDFDVRGESGNDRGADGDAPLLCMLLQHK